MELPNEVYAIMFNYLSIKNKWAIVRVCKIWYYIICNLALSKYSNCSDLIYNYVDNVNTYTNTTFHKSMIVHTRRTNSELVIRTICDTECYISSSLFQKYIFINYNLYENHFVVLDQTQCFRSLCIYDSYSGTMKKQVPRGYEYEYGNVLVSREYYAVTVSNEIRIRKLIDIQYSMMNHLREIVKDIIGIKFEEDIVIKANVNDFCLAGTDKFAVLYNNNTVEWIDAVKKERRKITVSHSQNLRFSYNNMIFLLVNDCTISIWDLEEQISIWEFSVDRKFYFYTFEYIMFSIYGQRIITYINNTLKIWNYYTKKCDFEFKKHQDSRICYISISGYLCQDNGYLFSEGEPAYNI